MKISISSSQENSPIISFTKLHVHRSTRLSQLHQIECSLDQDLQSSKLVAAYSLAEAFIMMNLAVQFAHNDNRSDKQSQQLFQDFQNLRSQPCNPHPKHPLCGKPNIRCFSSSTPTSPDPTLPTQHNFKSSHSVARKSEMQFRSTRRKARSSTGFAKLPEKAENDPVIDKLREKKQREFEKQASLNSKKKGRKDRISSNHRKLSSNKFTFDYDGTRILCSSQFKKRNMMQLIPMSIHNEQKVTSKIPTQLFQSKNCAQSSKVINRPVRISIYEHRNQYIHSISNHLNIPVETLLDQNKPKQEKKIRKKPIICTPVNVKQTEPEQKPVPQKAILTRDQRRDRNLIKVSSLWKQQVQDILEKVKNHPIQDKTGCPSPNPSFLNTPENRDSSQQFDATTNFDILILTSSEWGAGRQKQKPTHNPSSFKLQREMNMSGQNRYKPLKRARMQQIGLMWD